MPVYQRADPSILQRTFSGEVVFANGDETFAVGALGRGLGSGFLGDKAAALARDDDFLLVTQAALDVGGLTPVPLVVMEPRIGMRGLCADLLADADTLHALAAWLLQQDCDDIRITYQVWSTQLSEVVDYLMGCGVTIARDVLPSLSGQTVARWNTKSGGRELLATIPTVRPLLPAAIAVGTAADLDVVLHERRDRPLVVKPDQGLGGARMRFTHGPGPASSLKGGSPKSAGKGGKWLAAGTSSGADGWLVEEFVGDPIENISPSVDFAIGGDGVRWVGSGLQILRERCAYVGVRSAPPHYAIPDACREIGALVAEELRRYGYRGCLNLDFVVTPSGQVFVAEMNIRQSAPAETHAVLLRGFGEVGRGMQFANIEDGTEESSGVMALDERADQTIVYRRRLQKPSAPGVPRQGARLSVAAPSRLAAGWKPQLPVDANVGKGPNWVALEVPPVAGGQRDSPQVRDSGTIRDLGRRMRAVAAAYRRAYPLKPSPSSTGSYPIATNWGGRPATKVLAWFPSPGCAWSHAGGCTMCDFSADAVAVSMDEAADVVARHLKQLNTGTRRLHLGPGGSIFDDREVPEALRAKVLEATGALPMLRSLGVETRPSLVSEAKLLHAIQHLPSGVRELTLGFGLECLDDTVREVAVNKGYGPAHVDRAIAAIDAVNRAQFGVDVDFEFYVLLKPLFLTEREGIEEAVRTIEWCFGRGATTVALFMNTVKANTIQGYLAGRTDLDEPFRYEPPYFRSAISVLEQLTPGARKAMQVLGPQSGVLADGMPRGCPLCTPVMLGAVMGFNFTRDDAILREAAESYCPCKDGWVEALRRSGPPLLGRLDRGIKLLEDQFASPG